MSTTANGAGPALGAALDLVIPTLEDAETEIVDTRPNLETVGSKTYELLDAVAGALRAQIAMEQVGREEYEELVKASREREQQMARTLKTIEAQADAAEKRETKPKPKGHNSRRPGYRPKDEKLHLGWVAVLDTARTEKEFTVGAVAKHTDGIGPDTLMAAFEVYRSHELIRPVGKRKNGVLWSLMPGVAERGDTPWLVST